MVFNKNWLIVGLIALMFSSLVMAGCQSNQNSTKQQSQVSESMSGKTSGTRTDQKEQEVKEVVIEFINAWNTKNADGMRGVFSKHFPERLAEEICNDMFYNPSSSVNDEIKVFFAEKTKVGSLKMYSGASDYAHAYVFTNNGGIFDYFKDAANSIGLVFELVFENNAWRIGRIGSCYETPTEITSSYKTEF